MKVQRIGAHLSPAVIILTIFMSASMFAQDADVSRSRKKLPDISLPTIDGENWKLSDNLGKTVVLNFWATWCEPCRTEIPYLLKLSKEFDERDLLVFGVNLDEDVGDKVRQFITEYKVDYPVLVPPTDSPFRNLKEIPTTLLIDSEGRLVKRYTGAVPEVELRKDILSTLNLDRTVTKK